MRSWRIDPTNRAPSNASRWRSRRTYESPAPGSRSTVPAIAAPSKGRRRVDPEDAGRRLAGIAIAVQSIGAKYERIARMQGERLAVERQRQLALEHVADLFPLVLHAPVAATAGRDDVDVALQDVAVAVGH